MAALPFGGIIKSLGVTFRTIFRHRVTVQYPTERPGLNSREKGFPELLWDEQIQEPFCTGCLVCARYCPTNAIFVTMKNNPKHAAGESPRRKIVDQFFLDIGRCILCRVCVEVCNFDAIEMSKEVEFSEWNKQDLVMDLHQMLHLSKQANPRTRRVSGR